MCARRRVVLAAVLAASLPSAARADWQVHRTDSRALIERAELALRERPDDEDVARRLVRMVGPSGRSALRVRFQSRAQGATSYSPLAAYAQVLLALGDGPAAADAFAAALRLAPRSLPALVGRARALAAAGQAADALASYDEALRLEQRPPARRRLLEAQLALLSRDSGDSSAGPPRDTLERTISIRRELARLDPDQDAAAERLADALEQAGNAAEAAGVLEQRLAPGHTADKLPLALRAARLRLTGSDPRDAERAAAILADLIRQIPPGDPERRRQVWELSLKVARRRASLPELARDLSRASERGGGAVELDMLGQVRDQLGDLEGALEATRAALARGPHDGEVARRLIGLLERLGRDEEATAAFEELARRNPSNARLAAELIERRMRRGQRADAGAALDLALTRFARDRGALLDFATLASRWGEDQRALAFWQRLRRIDPKSEVVIIGLGEAQFQRGRKEEAKRTWALLRERARPAEGHLRLAEVLLEHDLTSDAAAEARRAQILDSKSIAPHRLLAQIAERQKKLEDAVAEWNLVLALASEKPHGKIDPAGSAGAKVGLRREARVRVLALLARLGRGRLEAQIRKLREEVKARPADLEVTMFLAEAQQRAGDVAGAIATLRDVVARARNAGAGDATVEAAFGLVALLKRSGQLDEAVKHLDEIGRSAPGRAREAQLQIAEIALAQYDTERALAHAAKAAADADGPTLARIAEIQSRAGADELAVATYRRAVSRDAQPSVAVALARLLERRGDGQGAAEILDTILRQSRDEEAIVEAGKLAIDLNEFLGRLPALGERLANAFEAGQDSAPRRRTLVAVLKRLLPTLYRNPASDEVRVRLGRHALRALLEVVTDAEQTPDRGVIELLGMLGNGDAAPALARVASRAPEQPANRRGIRPTSNIAASEAQLAAIIALGRLGDARGRAAIERHVASSDVPTRSAAVWALGRLADARVAPILLKAVEDRHPDVVSAACLGLGRRGDPASVAALVRIASDARRSVTVRRAAIVGLGHAGKRETTAVLFDLLDAGDDVMSRAAAMALVWGRDGRALFGLLARALLPRRHALVDPSAPRMALEAWAASASPPDEARLAVPTRLDLLAFEPATEGLPSTVDLHRLWRLHARDLQELLADALAHDGELRREALAALDGKTDGLKLGALTPEVPASPEIAGAVREIVVALSDRLAGLLDDPDEEVQASALRLLVKLGDERVTPARIAAATRAETAVLSSAAVFAAARLARERPTLAPAIAAAVAATLAEDSWRNRLTAVEVLAALGPPGQPQLERARIDKNPLVRAAALGAGARTP